MKKKNLKVLKLNRKTISTLKTSTIVGGTNSIESCIICPHGDGGGGGGDASWDDSNCTLISLNC